MPWNLSALLMHVLCDGRNWSVFKYTSGLTLILKNFKFNLKHYFWRIYAKSNRESNSRKLHLPQIVFET
jgi:hypothetical protein